MNRVILCEGKTDAILLSYYLGKICGWKHTSPPEGLAIKARNKNENVDWYKKGSEMLMICAVGGKDNFYSFFSRDLKKAMINLGAFSRIAIIADRDDRNIEDIEHSISSAFSPFFDTVQNREWCINHYDDGFGMTQNIDSLLLIIPVEQQGALETVMLSAIAENPYDANIVQKCTGFVSQMRHEANRYITTDRLQLKANLSTVWAIQSPEKVFDFINEQINAVEWERYETLRDCFGVLEAI